MPNIIVLSSAILISLATFCWILKRPIHGIYLMTFFLPILIIQPFPSVSYRIVIFDIFIFMTILSWVLNVLISNKRIRLTKPEIFISLSLFYLACLISFFNAPLFSRGIIEFLTYFYGGGQLFIFFQTVDDENKLRNVVRILIVSYVLVILFGLIQLLGLNAGYGEYLTWHNTAQWKITSTFRAPNQAVSYLCPIFPLFLFFTLEERRKTVYLGLLSLISASFLVLFATGSRTGVLLLLLILILFFLWKIKRLKIWGLYVFLFSILLLFFCCLIPKDPKETIIFRGAYRAVLVISQPVSWIWPEYAPINITKGYSTRYDMFLAGKEIIGDYPLFGGGLGNFSHYYVQKFPYRKPQELHNTYLGILAETGLFGFFTFFIFLVFVLREVKKAIFNFKGNDLEEIGGALTIGFISVLIYGLFHFGLRQRQFWFFLALILVINNITYLKIKKEG